ncbi:Thioredoxin-like fold protein [Raphanus sativus]|nr:Thioredoxin-like fold protein [Raphanus sativus]
MLALYYLSRAEQPREAREARSRSGSSEHGEFLVLNSANNSHGQSSFVARAGTDRKQSFCPYCVRVKDLLQHLDAKFLGIVLDKEIYVSGTITLDEYNTLIQTHQRDPNSVSNF